MKIIVWTTAIVKWSEEGGRKEEKWNTTSGASITLYSPKKESTNVNLNYSWNVGRLLNSPRNLYFFPIFLKAIQGSTNGVSQVSLFSSFSDRVKLSFLKCWKKCCGIHREHAKMSFFLDAVTCYVLYISNLNALSFAVKVKNMKIHYHSCNICIFLYSYIHIYVQNSLINSTHVFYYPTTYTIAKALHRHNDLRIMKTEIKRRCCGGRGEAHTCSLYAVEVQIIVYRFMMTWSTSLKFGMTRKEYENNQASPQNVHYALFKSYYASRFYFKIKYTTVIQYLMLKKTSIRNIDVKKYFHFFP